MKTNIFADIEKERRAQDAKWGGPAHDDLHLRQDWCRFIEDHNRRAKYEVGAFRRQMVRVAALAIAAIEAEDRKDPQ